MTIAELEDRSVKGETAILCKTCVEYISLNKLIPDITIVFFRGRKVRWEYFQIERELGKGAFATVHKALLEGQEVAVKKLEKENKQSDIQAFSKAFDEFRKEIFVMSRLVTPYCVQLYAVCLEPLSLAMEFIQFGDLYGFIHDKVRD